MRIPYTHHVRNEEVLMKKYDIFTYTQKNSFDIYCMLFKCVQMSKHVLFFLRNTDLYL